MPRLIRKGLTCLFVGALLLPGPAWAGRYVIINGQQMTAAQIRYLDRVSCTRVPDGAYWLDFQTDLWGYAGGRAEGYVGALCRGRRPGLSERGPLYGPGELLR